MEVLSHETAAALWGLDVRRSSGRHVTVPRNHSRTGSARTAIAHRADLAAREVVDTAEGPATSPLRTVADCARTLPFGWGLAAADSALRLGLITKRQLTGAVQQSRGPGATALRRVAGHADRRAGSCLESLLRALLIEADIGPLAPQARIFRDSHPYDLEIVGAHVLIEADGAAGHRDADRFAQDCEDITVAAREGYVVLRVTWYDVTRRPAWTADAVLRTADRQRARIRREAAAGARLQTRRAHRSRDAR